MVSNESEMNMDETMKSIDSFLKETIESKKIPGAVILVAKDKNVLFHKEYGYAQITPVQVPMKKDSIFDLASLTKIIAAWPATMLLLDQKLITLQHRIPHFYDYHINATLQDTNLLQLLTHTSGLSERTYLIQYGQDKETILKGILADGLTYPPNEQVKYCNRGFVLLGDMIEKAAGMSLDAFLKKEIWKPLGMMDTTFNPDSSLIDRVVATEYLPDRKMVKRGIVHDENAELLGGIAGHAGTFSTAKDLGKMCSMILDALKHDEKSIIPKDLIASSFFNYTRGLNEARGLAWQIYHESEESIIVGHYGFTGTTIWMDIKQNMYMILLTNRVHPSRDNSSIHSIRAYVRELLFPSWK